MAIELPRVCWSCGESKMVKKRFMAGVDAAGNSSWPQVGGMCRACGATWVPELDCITNEEIALRMERVISQLGRDGDNPVHGIWL